MVAEIARTCRVPWARPMSLATQAGPLPGGDVHAKGTKDRTVSGNDAKGTEEVNLPYAKQQRLPPWQWKDIRWTMGSYITLVHVLGIMGLFYIPECKTATLWCLRALAHRWIRHHRWRTPPLVAPDK